MDNNIENHLSVDQILARDISCSKTLAKASTILAVLLNPLCWIFAIIGIVEANKVLAIDSTNKNALTAKKKNKKAIILSVIMYLILALLAGIGVAIYGALNW